MDITFEEFLEKGTKRLLQLLSSSSADEEEKQAIIAAFTSELLENISASNELPDYDFLISKVSISHIDAKLSHALSDGNTSTAEYQRALELCARQKELVRIFSDKGWPLPKLMNGSLDSVEDILRKKQEAGSITNRILKIDRQLDVLLGEADNNPSTAICDKIVSLLDDMDSSVEQSKKERVALPVINNKNTRKIRGKLAGIRKVAEQKEALYSQIVDTDRKIHNLISLPKASSSQLQEAIGLCQQQNQLLARCNKSGWQLPEIQHPSPMDASVKCKHFLAMTEIDESLSANRSILKTRKQYRQFFSSCSQQINNIETCKKNNWIVPALSSADPERLLSEVRSERSHSERARKIKRRLILIFFLIVLFVGAGIWGLNKYRDGKIEMPFDASYAIGQDYTALVSQLEESGFKAINTIPDSSGWLPSNAVLSITVDSSEKFSKGSYYQPETIIVIRYSSENRVDISELLSDWQQSNYEGLIVTLKEAGFTKITSSEVATSDKSKDSLIANLTLNGQSYSNGHCYLPKDAPIEIAYYIFRIGIGSDNESFLGQEYTEVVSRLEEAGFTNVQTEEVKTGWAKSNTVVGVTVNNTTEYNGNDTYDPNTRIVVKYSSGERIEATDVLVGWQSKDWDALGEELRALGFSSITFRERRTSDPKQNNHVYAVTLNGDTYDGRECFLPKTTAIEIEYYSLVIRIGKGPGDFKKEPYEDIVNQLRAQGFTNIVLMRANDLRLGVLSKEGTIKEISFGGNSSFSADDSFAYDVEIVIIVHTFKNKGCEEITLAAD